MTFQGLPEELRVVSGGRELVYRLDPTRVWVAGESAAVSQPEARIEEPPLSLHQAEEARTDSEWLPVYVLEGDGPAAPTGRVFVRFRQDVRAAERQADLAEAGYRFLESLGYARYACWVEAVSGALSDCLGGLERLRAIEGVEAVEPQLLMPAGRR